MIITYLFLCYVWAIIAVHRGEALEYSGNGADHFIQNFTLMPLAITMMLLYRNF